MFLWVFFFFLVCISFFNGPGAYEWAQKTLKDHAKDKRPHVYTREQLEKAKTHDKLWNAAQVRRAVSFPNDQLIWGLCSRATVTFQVS